MSISVDVHLLSGKRASMEVKVDESVESLKHRAQTPEQGAAAEFFWRAA